MKSLLFSSFSLLCMLLCMALLSSCQHAEVQSAETPGKSSALVAVPVLAAKQETSYETTQAYLGLVTPRRSASLAFEVAGTLTAVHVDSGDVASTNQTLAALDTRTLEAQREEIRALLAREHAVMLELENGPRQEDIAAARQDLEALRAQDDLAALTRDRSQTLISKDVIAPQEWDQSRLNKDRLAALRRQAEERFRELQAGTRQEQIDAQRALVRRTEAQLEQINVLIDKSTLRMPWEGAITGRHVDEGAVVSPGLPVLDIIESQWLEARVGIAGLAATSLSPGQIVSLQTPFGSCSASVRALVPQRDTQRRTVEAVLDFNGPVAGLPIQAGDVVRLQLPHTHQTAGFWLPLTALTESFRGLWACYVAKPGPESSPSDSPAPAEVARIETRQVEVLAISGEAAYVRGALSHGDWVVAAGLHKVAPGQEIRPLGIPLEGQ